MRCSAATAATGKMPWGPRFPTKERRENTIGIGDDDARRHRENAVQVTGLAQRPSCRGLARVATLDNLHVILQIGETFAMQNCTVLALGAGLLTVALPAAAANVDVSNCTANEGVAGRL